MIKINIKHNKNQEILIFLIEGHIYKKNNEINTLCAIISTIVLGGINELNKKNSKNLDIKNYDGFSKIIVKKTNIEIQIILSTLITQLQTTILYFKKNISIKFVLIN